jgi:pimeloyl-ACP methyl ester carboxylesterase
MTTNSHTISTESDRKLCIIEAGQPDGVPVLVHHGTPGSNLLHPWIKDAESRGIRLISYYRPGYGGSTPQPGRTVASAANDVAAIAKHLDLDRLCVWGASGGGPHALACAALLPELVIAVGVLESCAPYSADGLDWFAGMGESNINTIKTALKGRDDMEQFIEANNWPWLLGETPQTFVNGMRSLLSPVDIAVFSEDVATYMLNYMREGSKDRRDGWVDDYIAFTTPWDFEVNQIKIPVLLMHGEYDRFVSISHSEWLAEHIPNVDARLLADDGHITLLINRIPEVHAWLLDQIK